MISSFKSHQVGELYGDIDLKGTGSSANVYWRSISMEDLRTHPNIVALESNCTEFDVSNFHLLRESSQEWDLLHDGRITTSIANVVLGFMEESCRGSLRIPPSYHGASHNEVIQRLRKERIQKITLSSATSSAAPTAYWSRAETPSFLSYSLKSSSVPPQKMYSNVQEARLKWGSVQEPIGLLTAANYLALFGGKLRENGLLTFPISSRTASNSHPLGGSAPNLAPPSLPVDLCGATPDGIAEWPTGRLEPVEVKSSSPFTYLPKNKGKHKLGLASGAPRVELPPMQIAQMMWHMAGVREMLKREGKPESLCESGIALHVTACGASLIRVSYSQEWMDLASELVERYMIRHVALGNPPPKNFGASIEAHRKLKDLTIRIAREAHVIAAVPWRGVQRSHQAAWFFSDRQKETVWPSQFPSGVRCYVFVDESENAGQKAEMPSDVELRLPTEA